MNVNVTCLRIISGLAAVIIVQHFQFLRMHVNVVL